MKTRNLHPWDVAPREAVAIQERLRGRVRLRDTPRVFRTVAGLDISYDRHSPWLFAAIVVLRLPDLTVVETAGLRAAATFPYVPGLLSFREAPAGLRAWAALRTRPDCLVCDGHGLAHPRRLGLACHVGLWVNLPTIGCAKSVLVGSYRAPDTGRGSRSALLHGDEVVGAALRTREAVSPVFVSAGHRISLERAVSTILACTPRFRIPEPIRQAHALVNRLRVAAR
jgi:deoxyribonuclease V